MSGLDEAVVRWLNAHAGNWPAFDRIVVWISFEHLVKGGVVAAVVWGLWFASSHGPDLLRRQRLISTMAAGLAAEMIARGLAITLPPRARPIHAADLGFGPVGGMDPTFLHGWSSFPSDHATLFFALATGAWFCSRRIGTALLAYVALMICLPRIYLGLHYPTDILGGAAIGIGTALVLQQRACREPLARPLLVWEQRSPATFYAAAMLFTLQYAVLFEGLRGALRLARELVVA